MYAGVPTYYVRFYLSIIEDNPKLEIFARYPFIRMLLGLRFL